jgi:glycosyltransferase involved in cell wall biosynthesis
MGDSLRVLCVCYLSLDDPLVRTQVVAYLEGLARRGHSIHLLTFDTPMTPARRESVAAALADSGIVWHSLRYHKRPSLPATMYDVFAGAVVSTWLVRRHRLHAIHARNHVPAAMALLARRVTGCRLIFDVRGLMADEYADAGRWRRGGLAYRMTNWIQRRALERADGSVVLTEAAREHLAEEVGPSDRHLQVIPCCVDTSRLNGSAPDRATARARIGFDGRPVMVYVGKFTGWYMEREMVDFYQCARRLCPGLAFLVLTQSDRTIIEAEFRRAGVPASDYLITRVEPSDVAGFLDAADFGISFVRPSFSKLSSSPTKVAEYLGAGLPVVATDIGDLHELFGDGSLGVLVSDFSAAAYEDAARKVAALMRDPGSAARCVAVARERLSLQNVGIPRYDALYRRVALK